jgi:threonine/homoserine/homoserine lactone efflux protein
MKSESVFNLTIFTDITKKICMCSFISMIIIILFVISPLSNFIKTSQFMKILVLILIFYTIYLNILQTNSLRNVTRGSASEKIKSQIQINTICSYIFTVFLGVLGIFVVKSFF